MNKPLLSDLDRQTRLFSHKRQWVKRPRSKPAEERTARIQAALAAAAPAPGGSASVLARRGIAAGTDTTVLCHR
jgi:hypothetical protein